MEEKPTAQVPENPQEALAGIPPFTKTPNELEPNPKKFSMLLGILAIFILAIGIAIGYKFSQKPAQPTPTPEAAATPTPDPTADWKTYSNSYWGFSFKYPQDILTNCDDKYTINEEVGTNFWKLPFICPDGHDILYLIGIHGYKPNKYLEYKTPKSTEKTSVNGIEATKKIYVYDENNEPLFPLKESTEIVLETKNGILVFQLLGNKPEDIKIFNQILATFKFTNETEKVDTSNWKTYTSIQNYQIKYPADWLIKEQMVTEFYSNDKKIIVSIFKNSDVNFDSIESRKTIYTEKPEEFKIIKDLIIDGKPAFMFDFLKKTQREVVLAGDLEKVPQTLFAIFITYVPDTKTEALAVFDQIISTFKFLE